MAISSLTRFSVPVAAGIGTQGLLMPKLKFRFRAAFINFGINADRSELTKQIIDIKRPSANFNPFTIDVYNSKINLVGKPEWQETTINLRDDAGGVVTKLVGEQIQRQFDFAEQASASSGIDYKFQLNYEVLDGGNGIFQPIVLESWELYGCLISSVDYGDMNYSTSDAATIALSIKFDNAIQVSGGVGDNVGRTFGVVTTG